MATGGTNPVPRLWEWGYAETMQAVAQSAGNGSWKELHLVFVIARATDNLVKPIQFVKTGGVSPSVEDVLGTVEMRAADPGHLAGALMFFSSSARPSTGFSPG